MQFNFLTPRVERLSADGRWTIVHAGSAAGRLRPPVVLLARDLATFSLFRASSLPPSRRGQAARLHARTGSPHLISASALVKTGADYGVWWWDAERVNGLVQARHGLAKLVVRPETLAQPPGLGWRVVSLTQGYEAQLWRNSGLVASSWRRERFDNASWAAFTRLQRDADDAPDAPPTPQPLPISFKAPAFALAASDLSREQLIAAGAGMLAMASIGTSLFIVGQGARLSADSEQIEKETSEIRAATPRTADLGGLEEGRRKLAAYAEVEARTSPLSAAGAAIGIVAFHDLTPTALETEGDTLTLTLPYTAISMADSLIVDFEESGYFYDIQPRTDAPNQRLVMEMKTREAAPPLSADG